MTTLYHEIQSIAGNAEVYDDSVEVNKQFKKAYDYLTTADELVQLETIFLFWLNHNNKKEYPLDNMKPQLPEIAELRINEFKERYIGTDEHRLNFFSKLNNFMLAINEVLKLAKIDLLIGGSFLDKKIQLPDDIDFVVLIPEIAITTNSSTDFFYNENKTKLRSKYENLIQKPIDTHFIFEPYSFNSYEAYRDIIMLGNKLCKKNKYTQDEFRNTTFEKRDVIKITFPFEEK